MTPKATFTAQNSLLRSRPLAPFNTAYSDDEDWYGLKYYRYEDVWLDK
jgi:hypothetical protein